MSSQTINRWHEIYSKMLKDSLHIGQNTTAPCPSKGASKNVTSNHIDNQCFVGEWQSQFALLLPRYSNLYVHFLQRPFALHMLSNRWFCVSLFPFFFFSTFQCLQMTREKTCTRLMLHYCYWYQLFPPSPTVVLKTSSSIRMCLIYITYFLYANNISSSISLLT